MITRKKKQNGPPPPPPQDRISELPVEILHRILGFLPMDEFLVRTSLVSHKWRYLWTSVSNLNFPHCAYRVARSSDDDDDDVDKKKKVSTIRNDAERYDAFVHHVLKFRDSEASNIQIFNYSLKRSEEEEEEEEEDEEQQPYIGSLEIIHEFIVRAANQGAQEIKINASGWEDIEIEFDPCIFNSRLLRVFTFDVIVSWLLHRVQFPRSMCCAAHLTHLYLVGIKLPKGDESDGQLHLVCPVLEKLALHCCSYKHLRVLDISAPRLNDLSIYNFSRDFMAYRDNLGGCRIEIRTPNLTDIYYEGDVFVDCFVENLPHVRSATLKFTTETDLPKRVTSFAAKLLKEIASASLESLELTGFEVFSQDTLKNLLTPFTGLNDLWLCTSYNISSIHGMVHILNSCNSITRLFWGVHELVEMEGDDEHLMLPPCKLSHLKNVHIIRLHGHENEIEFVKFLVRSSVVLEELIIHTTADSPKQSIEKNLKKFIKGEPSFRRIKLRVRQES